MPLEAVCLRNPTDRHIKGEAAVHHGNGASLFCFLPAASAASYEPEEKSNPTLAAVAKSGQENLRSPASASVWLVARRNECGQLPQKSR